MENNYKHIVPEWLKTKQEDIQGLILTDDIDSLLSCHILQRLFGYRIIGFYDFNDLYKIKGAEDIDINKVIFVDADITKEGIRAIGNHVTKLSVDDYINSQCFNLNNTFNKYLDSGAVYHTKYCGSSVLELLSALNVKLPAKDEVKGIITAIDSTFLGYYSGYERDNKSHEFYIREVMGFDEIIELEKIHTRQDFFNLIQKYNLSEKIKMNIDTLHTRIKVDEISDIIFKNSKIELPKEEFVRQISFFSGGNRPTKTNKNQFDSEIFSLAVTGKNYYCYTRYTTKK